MKTIKIAGLTFNLLNTYEAEAATAKCKHDFEPYHKDVIINPAGEFIEGYGNRQVAVRIASGKICKKCGLAVLEEKLDPVWSKKINAILKMKPKKNRTICQLLRELREEAADKNKVDACLVIAKKMNDKLVECAGKRYVETWYNENGDFIG